MLPEVSKDFPFNGQTWSDLKYLEILCSGPVPLCWSLKLATIAILRKGVAAAVECLVGCPFPRISNSSKHETGDIPSRNRVNNNRNNSRSPLVS